MIAASCSSDSDKNLSGEKGSIVIAPSIGMSVDKETTRTPDISTFTVRVEGPTTKTVTMPEDGKIDDLLPGSYTVTVLSHPDGIPAPDFDEAAYEGSNTAVVDAGQNTNIEVKCSQTNAGVYFFYHASVSDMDLIPTIAHADGNLTYSGTNKEKTGYFAPGNITITLKDGTESVQIGGANSQTFAVAANQIWKVTLTTDPITTGGIKINVTVVEGTVENGGTWEVTPGEPDEREVFEVTFTDGMLEYYGALGQGYNFDITLLTDTDADPYYQIFFENVSPTNTGLRIAVGTYQPYTYAGTSDIPANVYLTGEFSGGDLYSSQFSILDGDVKTSYAIIDKPYTLTDNGTSYTITGEMDMELADGTQAILEFTFTGDLYTYDYTTRSAYKPEGRFRKAIR